MYIYYQESRAATRKSPDAEVILFGLKFANNIWCSQALRKQGFRALLAHCVVVCFSSMQHVISAVSMFQLKFHGVQFIVDS